MKKWVHIVVQRAALSSPSRGKSSPVKVQDGYRTVENHWTDQYKHGVDITHMRFTELSSAEPSVFALTVFTANK